MPEKKNASTARIEFLPEVLPGSYPIPKSSRGEVLSLRAAAKHSH
jgi:hypothetical protein